MVLDLERLENMFSTFKKNQNCLKTRLLLHLSSFPPALCGTSLFPKYPFDLTCLPFWSWNVAKDKAVNSWWSSDRDRYESKGPEYTLENHPKKKTSIQTFYYEHIDYWYWHTLISCGGAAQFAPIAFGVNCPVSPALELNVFRSYRFVTAL